MRRLSLFGNNNSNRSDPFHINGSDHINPSAFGIGVYKGNVVAIKRIFKNQLI